MKDYGFEKRAKLFEDQFDNKPTVPRSWFIGLLWGVVGLLYLATIVGVIIAIGIILQ